MPKKSALSRKPKSQQVDDFINQGLPSSGAISSPLEEPESIARVQLRLSREKLRQIDAALQQRKVKVSRHVWFLEAIEDKLEKES